MKKRPGRFLLSAGNRSWTEKHNRDGDESKFKQLMNVAAQGILIHDYNFAPLFVNKSYARMLGYSVDEVTHLTAIDSLYPPGEKRRLHGYLNARLQKNASDEIPTLYEVEVIHKEGKHIILQHTVSLVDWYDQSAIMISAIDVTEQHQALHKMQLSEERFRDFADSASDWCWELNQDLRFSYLSDNFERVCGYAKEEILGINRREFLEKISRNGDKLSANQLKLLQQYETNLHNRRSFTDSEYSLIRKDGTPLSLSTSGKPIFNSMGEFCGYRGTGKNITEEKKMSEKLNFQATHDELTGLINRRYFDTELHKAIDEAHINQVEHALIYLDLDRFKIVNDTCGHLAGDELLQQLADLFRKVFSKRDVLARLGGDEFAVIMRHCTVAQSMRTTERLHNEFDRFRFIWEGKSFSVGVSIGVASINNNVENFSQLLQNADNACYMAKETGRNKTHVFSENDDDLSKRKGEMHWAVRIAEALEKNEFTLYAQPIVPVHGDGQGQFCELLIRLRNGDEIISPSQFLHAAERYDLSLNVDKWVLREALAWMRNNRSALKNTQLIFINLSAKTIGKQSFQDYTIKILKEYRVPAEKICFEITETTAIANLSEAASFIGALKEIGCHFALDDFGSGVSSFAYLKSLPVDYLKIDGVFIRDMRVNEVNLAMVKSINEISHVMGKKTIAEFVEDDATFALLRNMGVDYAQGYAIGYPVPIEELSSQS